MNKAKVKLTIPKKVIIQKKKSSSSQNSDNEMEQNKNNKEFCKLSFGENFDYNSLIFLFHGIKTYINLQRIIFIH